MSRRKEFLQVQKLIVRLSKREFTGLSKLSGDNELLNALIENLVMLGEELNDSTVSKEYFQDIFNSVPEIVLILNFKGEIVTGNNAMNAIKSNIRKQAGLNTRFNDFFESEDQRNPFLFLRKCVFSEQPGCTIKVKIKGIPGRVFNCKMDRLQSEHKAIKFLALINEITELENYQGLLIDSAIKYRQLFTDSSDGIFLFDLKGKVYERNAAMNALIKKDSSDLSDLYAPDYITPHQFSRQQLMAHILEKQQINNMEVTVKAADGSHTECLFSSTPVFDKKQHAGFQGVLKNISQYKEQNSILMRAMGEFQEKERKRIATDLHDSLGQQLSGIKFMVGTLARISLDPQLKAHLLQINTDIFQVIEELRKICFDLMPGSLEKFGLIKTIEELLSKLRKAAPGVTFSFTHTNRQHLSQEMELNIYRIVQEFVNNSLKYSGCKKIKISLTSSGNAIELLLKDDGIGIETKSIGEGKGMGLNNMLSRARAFHGTVTIQSKHKQGTTFIIKIPLSK